MKNPLDINFNKVFSYQFTYFPNSTANRAQLDRKYVQQKDDYFLVS